jgi:iron(III) transport system permease protein
MLIVPAMLLLSIQAANDSVPAKMDRLLHRDNLVRPPHRRSRAASSLTACDRFSAEPLPPSLSRRTAPSFHRSIYKSVPLITLLRWLAIGGARVWKIDEIAPALGQSLLFGGSGAALASLAAAPIAWLAIRRPTRLSRALEGINYVTSALPGVVVALALVTISVRFAHPLYHTVITVLLGYTMMFLPRALVSLRAGVAQTPVELEQVARSLGRSSARALWSLTLRLAAPSAAAGAAMDFLGIVNELTANRTETLATSFWALSGDLDYAAAAPYAALMVVQSLPLTGLLYRQSRRLSGR